MPLMAPTAEEEEESVAVAATVSSVAGAVGRKKEVSFWSLLLLFVALRRN